MVIKAIVFDLGGVCVGSPLHAINGYERSLGLPHNFLNFMIARWKSPSPMNLLEIGAFPEIGPEFYAAFEAHLNDAEGYEAFLQSAFYTPAQDAQTQTTTKTQRKKVDGRALFSAMMEAASVPNTPLLTVIQALRASGKYQVWALTNNFPVVLKTDTLVHALFHRVIGSVQMKMRKPDPRLYAYLIKELEVQSHEIVFLDDIGANLKAAKKFGIHTIQVDFRTTPKAIQQLNQLLASEADAKAHL